MAIPIKLVDLGGGAGELREFGVSDTVPDSNLSDNLAALGGLTGAADKLPYFTGAGALSLATLTAAARALLAASDQAEQHTALGLGTAAVEDVQTTTADTTSGRLLIVGATVAALGTDVAPLDSPSFTGPVTVDGLDVTLATSSTGSTLIAAGTTAERDVSPSFGAQRANSTTEEMEWWDGTAWVPMGGGGGGDSIPLFSVQWWPQRSAVPAGYVVADGQTLSRATYPDAWDGILASGVPVVAEATWVSTPAERGKFTVGDGSTTFRLPDYNGKYSGSLGALFLRGDGALSAAVAGAIQRDAFQGHHHTVDPATGIGGWSGSASVGDGINVASNTIKNTAGTYQWVRGPISDGTNDTPRTASETRPLNVTGCWVIKLFGAVVNVGSADAAQLASDYANLASRTTTLESKQAQVHVSSAIAGVAQGLSTITHGLGVIPDTFVGELTCIVAEAGFSIGDTIPINIYIDAPGTAAPYGSQIQERTTTQYKLRQGTYWTAYILNKSTGSVVTPALSSWTLKVTASRRAP